LTRSQAPRYESENIGEGDFSRYLFSTPTINMSRALSNERKKSLVYPIAVTVMSKLKFVIPDMLEETDKVNTSGIT
jgi:hypothetical protein